MLTLLNEVDLNSSLSPSEHEYIEFYNTKDRIVIGP